MSSSKVDRRDVLQLAAIGMTSTLFTASSSATEDAAAWPGIIDTNVSVFPWPFRRLPLETPHALVQKLQSLGVNRALAGSFEGILHRDIAGVNRRLAAVCAAHPLLIPIGSVHPGLPNWKEDLRHCVEQHGMPGIRLHPGYHGYTLTDPRFLELLHLATQAGLFVQLAVSMEDVRTQHALVRVPDASLASLREALTGIPQAVVQLLNVRLRPAAVQALKDVPGILFDTARLDGTDGVPALMKSLPPGRVLFGSHAPLLIPEAAMIRVHESGRLSEDELRAVYHDNAVSRLGVTTV